MKLQFISQQHIDEAVKFLAGKGHLPYTDASGSPNHRLMGAAWAALHGGYRGNKYEGPDKDKALSKLKGVYKSEKMDTPEESFTLDGEFFQEALAQSDSFDAIRSQVMSAINAKIKSGTDMDCDNDGAEDAGECLSCHCFCGQPYGCSCCAECSCKYPQTAWCMDLYPAQIVYSMEGEMFQVDYSIGADDAVTLGSPMKVETSYTPVVGGDCPMESFRILACNAVPLQESTYDPTAGKLKITIIRPGLNKSKARFYPAETLKRDFAVFEGAKMFADHQSEKEFKDKPEGSVNNWVASLKNVHAESDGTLAGDAFVIDPPFKAKLDELNKQGLLHEMGVSIRAIGEATEGEREGVSTNVVEALLAARSVDFVTYAGAGGQIEAMESARHDNEGDVDLVTEAGLRKRRPDLIKLVENHAQETAMKSLEQQLKESQEERSKLTKANIELAAKFEEAQTARTALETANKALTKEKTDMTAKLTEADQKTAAAEKASAKVAIASELATLLTESKLPDISQARIRKQFAEAEVIDGIKEAIAEEAAYVKHLGVARPAPKNLGASDNGNTREREVQEVTPETMAEAFSLLPGLSEKEAALAGKL